MPNITGVDVSSHQPGWRPAASDSFVFVKATENTDYANPERHNQLDAARAKGLAVGHYHYLHPGAAKRQAAWFVSKADIRAGEILWLDWENTDDGHPSVDDAAEFIAEVKRLRPRNKVGLYCNRSDWMNTKVKAGDALWLAQYGVDKPDIPGPWDFWQWTDTPIDQNRSRFPSLAALKAWANGRPTIDTATVTHQADIPITTAYPSRALWQGAAWAKNPLTGTEYLFQMQAQETVEGDIEHTWIHRYQWTGSTLTYLDSMRGLKFGHLQSLHVRISALGNPRIWLGVEIYDDRHLLTGTKVWRLLYTPGDVKRSGKHELIYTGKGSAVPISSPPGMIVLRRPSADHEVYEWHDETALRKWRSTIDRPKPLRTVTAARSDGTYQSSCASKDTIYRLNGSTDDASTLSQFTADGRVGRLDVTAATSPAAANVTSEEPEGVFFRGRQLYFVKRMNSVRRRVVSLFTVEF